MRGVRAGIAIAESRVLGALLDAEQDYDCHRTDDHVPYSVRAKITAALAAAREESET
jgi:hypothetical protein